MFTSKNLKTLIFVTNLAWYTGSVPYRFVKNFDGKLEVVGTFTRARRLSAIAHLCATSTYIGFIIFRLVQKLFFSEEKPSLDFLVKMCYLLNSYGLPLILEVNTLAYWEEVPRFLSQYVQFFRSIQADYMLKSEKGQKSMKFFTGVITISLGTLIQNISHIRKKPHQDHFFTSLLEDPRAGPGLVRYPLILLNLWVWLNTWFYIYIYCFHWYMYMSCGVFMSRELDIYVKKAKTVDQLREPKLCARLLRTLQVLHRIWQVNNEAWVCPLHKGAAMAVATLGIYGLVKLSGPRSIIMGIVAFFSLLYMATLFRKFGKFKELSRKTLDNWLHAVTTTKYMRKFISSVPEYRVNIGSFYAIEKFTIASVMWAVLNNTITLFFI